MLKKILGQAPFDVSLSGDILVVPGEKTTAVLCFVNDCEYDLPLSCSLRIESSVNVDTLCFDVILPAEGNTKKELCFSLPKDSKIVGGISVCELEIIDRILDSKTVYEIEIKCETAYKCCETSQEAFLPTDDVIYTRNGRFFANKNEIISIEVPAMEEYEIELSVISGEILGFSHGQTIKLLSGLNRLSFEMSQDGSFELKNTVSGDTAFLQTLNPKYFI